MRRTAEAGEGRYAWGALPGNAVPGAGRLTSRAAPEPGHTIDVPVP